MPLKKIEIGLYLTYSRTLQMNYEKINNTPYTKVCEPNLKKIDLAIVRYKGKSCQKQCSTYTKT